ncbi:methylated-DNA--[protein]-cysteine S-methyltransferase [Marinilabiliaceae bacterium JC017]|nr:methylated-DNA--[protein]-cysteine S-methyltransferase [Marinilabiliaceae bacterium JC017]
MFYDIFNSPYGEIILVGDEAGIAQLLIDNGTKEIHLAEEWTLSNSFFANARHQLEEYFAGKRKNFQLKLNPGGTDFQQKVWQELTNIPYGESRCYKDIAIAVGNPKAARAIGMANNRNPIPIIIPCHRVIGANKKLAGYAYGLEVKQQLLQLEASNHNT